MDITVAEDLPAWEHALHAHEALLEFLAYVDAQNIALRNFVTTEPTDIDTEWPFSEYPQTLAVQDMYKPEPKQMPTLCFQCEMSGLYYAIGT